MIFLILVHIANNTVLISREGDNLFLMDTSGSLLLNLITMYQNSVCFSFLIERKKNVW